VLSAIGDLATVEASWRALEAEAAPSFFQTWTWVGCLAAERFADPVLLRAERGGRTVALALLNRTRGRFGAELLWLNESGDPALDAIYVEHSGVLLALDAGNLLPACLRAILTAPIAPSASRRGVWRLNRQLRLAGVDAAHLAAAQHAGALYLIQKSTAPFVDLTALAAGPDAYLASLSANTRYQIRRSDRCFARLGPLAVRQAETLDEGLAFLDALAALHQASWAARGVTGAFANPAFLHFHRSLVTRGFPRGEITLLQITAGPLVLGYLYNLRLHHRVLAYQSGFDYAAATTYAGPHAKPGLTCHHAAILHARADGATAYDFLAGPDRYKTSLARAATPLYWLDVTPRFSVWRPWLQLRILRHGAPEG
jgi:CelD/BcsL family acetyltransferase involved in cellulose biosynthesis